MVVVAVVRVVSMYRLLFPWLYNLQVLLVSECELRYWDAPSEEILSRCRLWTVRSSVEQASFEKRSELVQHFSMLKAEICV